MGKTSTVSRLNVPGKLAWMIMELPGPFLMAYMMYNLPKELGLTSLPWENLVLAGIFMIHYSYRAVIAPLINPSMSPIHPLIILIGWLFQYLNAVSIAGWLGGYGHTTRTSWHSSSGNISITTGARMELGFIIWALGFAGTIWHDDELREIRRAAARKQKRIDAAAPKGEVVKEKKNGVDKVYMLPQNGLFNFVLSPHYFCEWIEWTGFWIMCGSDCAPARNFVLNEVATMLPRALQTRRWYVERFGKEKVGNRKAVIPGII